MTTTAELRRWLDEAADAAIARLRQLKGATEVVAKAELKGDLTPAQVRACLMGDLRDAIEGFPGIARILTATHGALADELEVYRREIEAEIAADKRMEGP